MELAWIETFLAVAETGSFRAAARVRYVSQAAVSQQIARLERELGVTLFDRGGRRARLNAAGARFRPDAERLLTLWRHAAAAAVREATRERLVIGADWLSAETVIPWLCRQLLLRRPEADLVVRPLGRGAEAWDVAVSGEAVEVGGLRGSLLFSDPIVWVTAAGPGDLDQPPPDPDRLLVERRVLMPGEARYWPALAERLGAMGFKIRTIAASQPSVIKRLVAEGVGTSFLPELLVQREVMEGRLLALALPWLDGLQSRTHFLGAQGDEGSLADLAARLLFRRFSPATG